MKIIFFIFLMISTLLLGCGGPPDGPVTKKAVEVDAQTVEEGDAEQETTVQALENGDFEQEATDGADEFAAALNPEAITVLVNKHYSLPEGYTPDDLVYPDVRFTFQEKNEKRMMRKEAAEALEKLFAAADQEGLPLAGVSAYRSQQRQKQLFDAYVRKDGLKKAQTYSAYPGTSEHQTGLAIDVAGADGSCAIMDCFGSKPEAKWLAGNAFKFGYIIRYPQGKEEITGYKYEPWHLRYVGKTIAEEIQEGNMTLEEYFNAVPV